MRLQQVVGGVANRGVQSTSVGRVPGAAECFVAIASGDSVVVLPATLGARLCVLSAPQLPQTPSKSSSMATTHVSCVAACQTSGRIAAAFSDTVVVWCPSAVPVIAPARSRAHTGPRSRKNSRVGTGTANASERGSFSTLPSGVVDAELINQLDDDLPATGPDGADAMPPAPSWAVYATLKHDAAVISLAFGAKGNDLLVSSQMPALHIWRDLLASNAESTLSPQQQHEQAHPPPPPPPPQQQSSTTQDATSPVKQIGNSSGLNSPLGASTPTRILLPDDSDSDDDEVKRFAAGPFEMIWSQRLPIPAQFAVYSPDSRLFASVGENDRMVKVWFRREREYTDYFNDRRHMFSFTYLTHPRAVTSISWRTVDENRVFSANVLLTSCKDGTSRIWSESSWAESFLFYMSGSIDCPNVQWLRYSRRPTPTARNKRAGAIAAPSAGRPEAEVFPLNSHISHTELLNGHGQGYIQDELMRDNWDLCFAVGLDGLLSIWRLDGLDGQPRRIPRISKSGHFPSVIPPADALSIAPNGLLSFCDGADFPDSPLIPSVLQQLVGAKSSRQHPVVTPPGRQFLLTLHTDGRLIVWGVCIKQLGAGANVTSVHEVQRCSGHNDQVHAIVGHSQLPIAFSIGRDSALIVWSMNRARSLSTEPVLIERTRMFGVDSTPSAAWFTDRPWLVMSADGGAPDVRSYSPVFGSEVKGQKQLAIVQYDEQTYTLSLRYLLAFGAQPPAYAVEHLFVSVDVETNALDHNASAHVIGVDVSMRHAVVWNVSGSFDVPAGGRLENDWIPLPTLQWTDSHVEPLCVSASPRTAAFMLAVGYSDSTIRFLSFSEDLKQWTELEDVRLQLSGVPQEIVFASCVRFAVIFDTGRVEIFDCQESPEAFRREGRISLPENRSADWCRAAWSNSGGGRSMLALCDGNYLGIFIRSQISLEWESIYSFPLPWTSAASVHIAWGDESTVLLCNGEDITAYVGWNGEFPAAKPRIQSLSALVNVPDKEFVPLECLGTACDELVKPMPQYHPKLLRVWLGRGKYSLCERIMHLILKYHPYQPANTSALTYNSKHPINEDDAADYNSVLAVDLEIGMDPVSSSVPLNELLPMLTAVVETGSRSSTSVFNANAVEKVAAKVVIGDEYGALFGDKLATFDDVVDEFEEKHKEEAVGSGNPVIDKLVSTSLPYLTRHEQLQLTALVEAFAGIYHNPGALDKCGVRFLLAAKEFVCLQRLLPVAQRSGMIAKKEFVWALLSETQDDLINLCLSTQGASLTEPTWEDIRRLGAGYWLKTITSVRTWAIKIAKGCFAVSKEPLDAALFYIAMRKKTLVQGLFKIVQNTRLHDFFANDFTTEQWQTAALKNAFALLGKQRFLHAACFFLLGDALKDCVHVLVRNLKDPQLALLVCRLYEPQDTEGLMYRKTLEDYVLAPAEERSDRWMQFLPLWIEKKFESAFERLLKPVKRESRDSQVDTDGTEKLHFDTDILEFFTHVRTHMMLKNVKVSIQRERKLVYETVFAYMQQGMSLLALEVLSQYLRAPPMLRPIDTPASTIFRPSETSSDHLSSGRVDLDSWETSEPPRAVVTEEPKSVYDMLNDYDDLEVEDDYDDGLDLGPAARVEPPAAAAPTVNSLPKTVPVSLISEVSAGSNATVEEISVAVLDTAAFRRLISNEIIRRSLCDALADSRCTGHSRTWLSLMNRLHADIEALLKVFVDSEGIESNVLISVEQAIGDFLRFARARPDTAVYACALAKDADPLVRFNETELRNTPEKLTLTSDMRVAVATVMRETAREISDFIGSFLPPRKTSSAPVISRLRDLGHSLSDMLAVTALSKETPAVPDTTSCAVNKFMTLSRLERCECMISVYSAAFTAAWLELDYRNMLELFFNFPDGEFCDLYLSSQERSQKLQVWDYYNYAVDEAYFEDLPTENGDHSDDEEMHTGPALTLGQKHLVEKQRLKAAWREDQEAIVAFCKVLLGFIIVQYVSGVLRGFLRVSGYENDIEISPLLSTIVHALEMRSSFLQQELRRLPYPRSLRDMFINSQALVTESARTAAVCDPQNNPFNNYDPSLRRLWHFLVRQGPMQNTVLYYMFHEAPIFSLPPAQKPPQTASGSQTPEVLSAALRAAGVCTLARSADGQPVNCFCFDPTDPVVLSMALSKELSECSVESVMLEQQALMAAAAARHDSELNRPDIVISTAESETGKKSPSASFLAPKSTGGTASADPSLQFKSGTSSGGANTPAVQNVYDPADLTAQVTRRLAELVVEKDNRKHTTTGRQGPGFGPSSINTVVSITNSNMRRAIPGIRWVESHPVPEMPFYLSGGSDGLIQLWQFGQVDPLHSYRNTSRKAINRIRFNSFGIKFGACDAGGELSLWRFDGAPGIDDPFQSLLCHKSCEDCVFLDSASLLATCGFSQDNRNVCVWDTLVHPNRALVKSFNCHEGGATAVSFSAPRQVLFSGGKDGKLNMYDMRARSALHSWKLPNNAIVRCLEVVEDRNRVLIGTSLGEVIVQDMTWFKEIDRVNVAVSNKPASLFRTADSGTSSITRVMAADGFVVASCSDGSIYRFPLR